MQRQKSPPGRFNSILLYDFGLALVLSLVVNGFLLHERSLTEYDYGGSVHPVAQVVWIQQFSGCKRANQQKDSLIRQLEQAPNTPPVRAVTVQLHSPK